MSPPVHEVPEQIVFTREEHRLQHAAFEAALDVLDRVPASGADPSARRQIETALQSLLRRIWPYLDELDDRDQAGADENLSGGDDTLGEAAPRAGTTVAALLALIYEGRLPAVPEVRPAVSL